MESLNGKVEMEKGKGKHTKIKIEQFDQIFNHIGGVGLFQIVYAVLIGKYLQKLRNLPSKFYLFNI